MGGTPTNKKLIDTEKVSIDALVHFLVSEKCCEKVLIDEELDDPPDFWMTVAGERFAVEVTTITNDYTHEDHRNQLREAIEKECRKADCPHGVYMLGVTGRPQLPSARTKRGRETIQKAVNEVLTLGKRSITAPVFEDETGQLHIKRSLGGSSKFHLAPMVECWWAGEYDSNLLKLFQTAIDKKIGKLEKKGVLEKCDQAILAFYDAFLFSDMEDAVGVFKQVERVEFFHSVFWAASFTDRPNIRYPNEPGRGGCFLYSKNPQWL